MEERRRSEDKRWEEMEKFIIESREYRAADSLRQSYVKEKIDDIAMQVKKTNGRVDNLEDFKQDIETQTKGRKEASKKRQEFLSIGAAVVAAIAAVVAIIKK